MLLTIVLSIIIMAGFFLMLLTAVVFIQDQKYFTSAPKEVQAVLLPREERFRGQHALGYALMGLAVLLMVVPLVYAGIDGVRNGFTYRQFFLRFAVISLLMKAFDILFFDWYILCRSHFFQHFYPECSPLMGPHLFGFNKKSHAVQIVLFLIASAVLAGICVLF